MVLMLSLSFAAKDSFDRPRAGGDEGVQRIYGGSPSPQGAWRHTVALTADGEAMCTGTLIAPQVVLTAAHCMGGGGPDAVSFGNNAEKGESVEVESMHLYPDPDWTYDVAVLRLKHAAPVAHVQLAMPCVMEKFRDGDQVTVVGFGATEDDDWNVRKNEVTTIVRDHDCSDTNRFLCNQQVSPNGEFVAGKDGKDSCYGDSGGPVYYRTGGVDYLVGVTSRGATDHDDCGHGGVYVRPDAIFGWIEAQSGTTLDRPDCDDGSGQDKGPDANSGEPGDEGLYDTGGVETWDTGGWGAIDPGFKGCSTGAPVGLGLTALLGGLVLLGRRSDGAHRLRA